MDRRLLGIGLAGAVLVAVAVIAAIMVTRPSPAPTLVVGDVADFPIGSVTPIDYEVTGVQLPEDAAGATIAAFDSERRLERSGSPLLFVVNDADVGLLALWARDPHRGCRVSMLESDSVIDGPTDPETVFYNPCHGEQYRLDGTWITGPSPRGLDRFALFVEADGAVVVDVRSYEPGPDRPSP